MWSRSLTEMHQPKVIIRGDVGWILSYWTDAGRSEGQRFTSRGKSTRIFIKERADGFVFTAISTLYRDD